MIASCQADQLNTAIVGIALVALLALAVAYGFLWLDFKRLQHRSELAPIRAANTAPGAGQGPKRGGQSSPPDAVAEEGGA